MTPWLAALVALTWRDAARESWARSRIARGPWPFLPGPSIEMVVAVERIPHDCRSSVTAAIDATMARLSPEGRRRFADELRRRHIAWLIAFEKGAAKIEDHPIFGSRIGSATFAPPTETVIETDR